MAQEQNEFELDLDDITPRSGNVKRLPMKLPYMRALVSHVIAVILVGGLVLSIILYVILVCKYPEQLKSIETAFEKWYSIMGPFAGLALGAYYGESKNNKQ